MFTTRISVGNVFLKRQIHGNAEIINNCKEVRNRNPRNLERLRISRKPAGYNLEKPGRLYWHKLVITPSARYITAEVHHFENGTVISTSTKELSLRKQLFRMNDGSAYINVGRVFARRCLESGISEMYFDESSIKGEKVKLLVDELKKSGIILEEPSRYKHPNSWDQERPEKPWEIHE